MRARTKIILSSGFFLLTLWIIFLYINYTDFQNLRHEDIFWVLNLITPTLFIILLGLVVTIATSLWYDVDNKWVHVSLLSIFGLVLLCTPYFVSGVARFPDTFGVISSVENLPQLLNGGYNSYAANYPLSYMLFYSVDVICDVGLLLFSRALFSPLVILSFFILWYLLIGRITSPKVAFLSAFLAMPVMLIEVSITPNAVAMIIVLTTLLLLSIGSWRGQMLAIVLALSLVLVHPFNIIILAVILIAFKLGEFVLKRPANLSGINVSLVFITIIAVAWLGWGLFVSPMGTSVIDSIINVFSFEFRYSQQLSEYSVGAGNLSYAWIQQLTQASYLIVGMLAATFVSIDLIYILRNKFGNPDRSKGIIEHINTKIVLILIASSLLVLSFSSMLFVAGGEQIVSRTLNYAMLALSTYISVFTIMSILKLTKKNKRKLVSLLFVSIIMVAMVLSTVYPLRGYAKDSYISYSESFVAGRIYGTQYNDETSNLGKLTISESNEYYGLMVSNAEYEKITSIERYFLYSSGSGLTYTNQYYSVFQRN